MKVQIENTTHIANFDELPIGQVFVWEDVDNVFHSYVKFARIKADLCIYNAIDLETGDLETFTDEIVIIPKNYSFKIEV